MAASPESGMARLTPWDGDVSKSHSFRYEGFKDGYKTMTQAFKVPQVMETTLEFVLVLLGLSQGFQALHGVQIDGDLKVNKPVNCFLAARYS